MAKPNLNMVGRTAGSPDNAQGTHFFLINDSGTYFLRKLPPPDDPSAAFTPEALLARAARGQGASCWTAGIDVPGGEARLPGLPRLQPVPVEPARHHDPVPGGRPVAAVHQRDDVPADPARRARGRRSSTTATSTAWPASRSGSRTGFLNKDIKLPLGTIWLDAHPDRGRPAAAEPDADRRRDGARRLDPRLARAAVLLGDPKFTRASTARCWASTGRRRAGSRPTSCAGRCRCRGTPTCAPTRSGCGATGEHLIKAMCPPNYASDGRRGRRGRRRQVRARRHLHRRGAVRARSTRASSAQRYLAEAQQLRGGRHRLHARHLHLHLRHPRPLPGARATRSTCPACGCRCTTSRRPTTSGSSATA